MGARPRARLSCIISLNAHNNSMQYFYFLLLLLLLINHRNKMLSMYSKITKNNQKSKFLLLECHSNHTRKSHIHITSFLSQKQPWEEGGRTEGPTSLIKKLRLREGARSWLGSSGYRTGGHSPGSLKLKATCSLEGKL